MGYNVKVYCEYCGYLKGKEIGIFTLYRCFAPSNLITEKKGYWYRENIKISCKIHPEKKNRNNNCKDYEQKTQE